MKTFLSSQTITTIQQVNGLHSTCRIWWSSTFRNTQSESKLLNIYIFLNTYLVIVSAINPCGSHKQISVVRDGQLGHWLTVSVTCSLRMRAFPHARADPVTVACSSYDWNTLTKYNGDGTQSVIPTIWESNIWFNKIISSISYILESAALFLS